mgnify:CR=1 FL=1
MPARSGTYDPNARFPPPPRPRPTVPTYGGAGDEMGQEEPPRTGRVLAPEPVDPSTRSGYAVRPPRPDGWNVLSSGGAGDDGTGMGQEELPPPGEVVAPEPVDPSTRSGYAVRPPRPKGWEFMSSWERGMWEKNNPPVPPTQQAPSGASTTPPPPQASSWNEETFRQGWLQPQNRTVEDLRKYIESGGWGQYLTPVGSKGDKYRLPNGRVIDLVLAAGAGGQGATWNFADEGGGGGAQQGGGGGSTLTAAGLKEFDPTVRQAILELLQRGRTPVGTQDVIGQYAPLARLMERNAQQTRGAAAERLAFQGVNRGGAGGPLDAEVNSINERLGEQQQGLMASLLGQEIQARRGDLTNALQFAQGSERMQLQLQLSQLDNELRRFGMGQQNRQFYDNLQSDIAWREAQLNRDPFEMFA